MTFSIVARDASTRELGVAVQTHWFSVGNEVPWAKVGVGAVATQASLDKSYGPIGLSLMSAGKSASQALSALLGIDQHSNVRQVAMVDRNGQTSAHTGTKCNPIAGHYVGDGFSCQANLMDNDSVWKSMAKSYESSQDLPLAERMISALEAGQASGGDVRGRQSAAILVVSGDSELNDWRGKLVDLRVDDNPDPIGELKRLLRLSRAYDWANSGETFLSTSKVVESIKAFEEAVALAPEVEELLFWQAVGLVRTNHMAEAMPKFREVYRKNKGFVKLTQLLIETGALPKNMNPSNTQ